jgi:hypothetical protein
MHAEVFRCSDFGARIRKLLVFIGILQQTVPDRMQPLFQGLLAVVPAKELIETMSVFKSYLLVNSTVRGRLPGEMNAMIDALNQQFAAACKEVPKLYFCYTVAEPGT